MTQKTITQTAVGKAYPAITRLTEARLPAKKAYLVYLLAKKLKEAYEFAIAEEKKLVDEYNGVIDSDGVIKFKDKEVFGEFQDRIIELHQVEVEIEYEPIVLSEQDITNLNITAADISNLEDFVSFE